MENFVQARQPHAGCIANQFTAFAHCPLPGKWRCVPAVPSIACRVYRQKTARESGKVRFPGGCFFLIQFYVSMCLRTLFRPFPLCFLFLIQCRSQGISDRTLFLRPGAVSIRFPWPGLIFRSPGTCLFSWTLLLLSGPVRIPRISYSLFSSSSRSSS